MTTTSTRTTTSIKIAPGAILSDYNGPLELHAAAVDSRTVEAVNGEPGNFPAPEFTAEFEAMRVALEAACKGYVVREGGMIRSIDWCRVVDVDGDDTMVKCRQDLATHADLGIEAVLHVGIATDR